MSLEELRQKIDEADTKIVKLIAERIRITEEIGREKRKQGKQIEDAEREKGSRKMLHLLPRKKE